MYRRRIALHNIVTAVRASRMGIIPFFPGDALEAVVFRPGCVYGGKLSLTNKRGMETIDIYV